MEPYVCRVPLIAPSLNVYTRMHWAQQKKVRETFQDYLWAVLNEHGNRCPRGLRAIDVRAIIQFNKVRNRDSDNFGSVLAKFSQDVFTREGIITDDTADRCTFHPPRIIVGEVEQTVLIITERSENSSLCKKSVEEV